MGSLLVGDDDRDQRPLLTEKPREGGRVVRAAADASDALAEVSAAMPGLVVLDLGTPGMARVELLGIGKRLPVVSSSRRAPALGWLRQCAEHRSAQCLMQSN